MKNIDKIKRIIDTTEIIDDCQNKFDLDNSIIRFSSRGYDRNEKSIYVGFYIGGDSADYTDEDIDFEPIIEAELFANSKEELIVKARKWYKRNLVKALKLIIDNNLIKDGLVIKEKKDDKE